jgi:hypothetical protein
MKENELTGHFNDHPVLKGLTEAITTSGEERISISGLSGSSKAMALPENPVNSFGYSP